jgi:hypothetical protein
MNMAIGLVIMKWDERTGAELVARYPDELELQDKTMMQIYSTHEYTGEAGMISMTVGSINIASYYTGPDSAIYVILLLTLDEDADAFEDGLADISRMVISNIETSQFKSLIPSYFQRLSVYPTLTPEQRLMMLYTDEAKRMVFNRLQKEGSIMKSEILVWLKDQFRTGFIEIDSTLNLLTKEGLIKLVSVKGLPSEVVFLIRDLIMTRTPPVQILKESGTRGLPTILLESYKSEISTFFKNYVVSDEDNLEVMQTLLDPQVWETFLLLRQAVVTRNDIEKLRKKGVDDPDTVLKKLWTQKIIVVVRDEAGTEYYGLLTDFLVEKFYPEYMINTIRANYSEKTRGDVLLFEYLDILEDQYQLTNPKAVPKKTAKAKKSTEKKSSKAEVKPKEKETTAKT